VADETYVGGTPSNRHRSAPGATSKAGRGIEKTAIMSLIHARTGEVRSRVMPTVDSTNVAKVLSEHVNVGGSVLWTDEGSWFKPVGRQFLLHETVNHAQVIRPGFSGGYSVWFLRPQWAGPQRNGLPRLLPA